MNLTRSLEKLLDDCVASGELRLTNRKLKDFPKCYGKFNLSDTVFAGKHNGIIYSQTCSFMNRHKLLKIAQMHEKLCA